MLYMGDNPSEINSNQEGEKFVTHLRLDDLINLPRAGSTLIPQAA